MELTHWAAADPKIMPQLTNVQLSTKFSQNFIKIQAADSTILRDKKFLYDDFSLILDDIYGLKQLLVLVNKPLDGLLNLLSKSIIKSSILLILHG